MKVVALSGISREAGGLFFAVGALCKELHASGVDVVAMGEESGFSNEDQAWWHPVEVVPFKGYGPLRTSITLRKQLARSVADLVHVNGIWQDDQWAAFGWQKKTGKPVVVSPHGMLDPWALQNSAWKKRGVEKLFARKALKHATCIHALCRSEATAVRAYGLKNPIAVIPNGVALPEIGLRPARDGVRKMLFLGRIHPKKGLCELLQAWAGLPGSSSGRPGWKLLVAGWDDGGHEAGLKALVSELGLEGAVDFIGAVYGEKKDQLLRSVDAFILPSFSEGLPMSVLEAWSYGLPVIMTCFCNLPEGFEADAAVRVEPDTASIASGLGAFMALDETTRQDMGRRGRKLVETCFSWPMIAGQMQQVYAWCRDPSVAPPACMITD